MAERWWWSLKHERAVTDEERGPDLEVLGPYPTKEAAEDWQATVEARAEAWKAEDERWEGTEPEDGDDDAPAGADPRGS